MEARLRELEELQSSSELLELRALVEAQEAETRPRTSRPAELGLGPWAKRGGFGGPAPHHREPECGPKGPNVGHVHLGNRPGSGALIEDLSSHLNATSSLDGQDWLRAPKTVSDVASLQASSTAANASAAIPPSSKEPAPSPNSPDPQGNCVVVCFWMRVVSEILWQVRVRPVHPSAGAAVAMDVGQ